MKTKPILLIILSLSAFLISFILYNRNSDNKPASDQTSTQTPIDSDKQANNNIPQLPMFIEALRKRDYPKSDIVIEQTLTPGSNYQRHIAYYHSDGLKIYGLFTVPNDPKPKNGFPAILFIHGYLAPEIYNTTERYVAYQDGFARNGFLTFKPDLRGHGRSEGESVTSSFSDGYVVDTLNLLSAFKADDRIDPKRIGLWGHSMGGGIGLRSMVVSKEIKAGVFWAGVVGDYEDQLQRYQKRSGWLTNQASSAVVRDFYEKYGSPSANQAFWKEIDPYAHLKDISGPVQLDHGTLDDSVPVEFSAHLHDALQEAGKTVVYNEYVGSDHNIAQHFNLAMQRSIDFFKKYL